MFGRFFNTLSGGLENYPRFVKLIYKLKDLVAGRPFPQSPLHNKLAHIQIESSPNIAVPLHNRLSSAS